MRYSLNYSGRNERSIGSESFYSEQLLPEYLDVDKLEKQAVQIPGVDEQEYTLKMVRSSFQI